MLVTKTSKSSIEQAAQKMGFELLELRAMNNARSAFRFRIVPKAGSDKYRKTSASYFNRGRRVHAICWHGHREFFRLLFKLSPAAIVRTALAKYTADNFENTYPNTDKNIGPPVAPIYYSECCDCYQKGLA